MYQHSSCRLQTGEPVGARAYLRAVRCANASTLGAVRAITQADPGAVIVLASDHGSDVGIDLNRSAALWPSNDKARRFSNFAALRLPRDCRDDVPSDLAAVNIFRVVVNCVTTSRLRLLPYRRFIS